MKPKWETKFAREQHAAFLEEYKDRILPPDHPLTRQVSTIVNTILQANHLGSVASTAPQNYFAKTGDDDVWDPDMKRMEEESIKEDSASLSLDGRDAMRQWNLIVVDDMNTVNAAAGYSQRFAPLERLTGSHYARR